MLAYLLYTNQQFTLVLNSGEKLLLSPQLVKDLGRGGAVVLANLSGEGVILLQLLHSYNMDPKIFGFKLNIIRLECCGVVFKDSERLGVDLNEGHEAIINKIYELRIFLQRLLKISLYDKKVSSLSYIAALLLKRHCPDLSNSNWEEHRDIFAGSYFGGRAETFGTTHGSSFDYPAMYANIQREPLPLRFSYISGDVNIKEYGLHKIKYCYTGESPVVRLPSRNANGSVIYLKEGVGWFWHNEISAFVECGGTVESLGECLAAKSLGPYLRRLQEFLIKERKQYGRVAKIISNSIYGRLALRPTNLITKWREFDVSEIYEGSLYGRYKIYGNVALFETESDGAGLAVQTNLAWASLITATGRSKIMVLALECERQGVGVSKIATDCIFTKAGGEFIIDGKLFR